MKRGWRIGLWAVSAVRAVLWAVLFAVFLVWANQPLSPDMEGNAAFSGVISAFFIIVVPAVGVYSAAVLCACLFVLFLRPRHTAERAGAEDTGILLGYQCAVFVALPMLCVVWLLCVVACPVQLIALCLQKRR